MAQNEAQTKVVVDVEIITDLALLQAREAIDTDQSGIVCELEGAKAPQTLESRDSLNKLSKKKDGYKCQYNSLVSPFIFFFVTLFLVMMSIETL